MNLALKHLAFWPLIVAMLGCASQGDVSQRTPSRTTAILGVALLPGVESGRSQNAMARDLEDLMQAHGDYNIVRSADVSRTVNAVIPGTYDTLLSNYAKSGTVKGNNLKALQSAQLPVQTALIARIEKNVVRPGTPKRVELRNNAGEVLSDRERIVLSTVREMQVSASLLNIASGRVIWSKSYRATPAKQTSYVHYSGSSFSGSLAASFANTMSNGLRVPSGPVPPSNLLTLRSLLTEIVRNIP